jgi:hypothetical protein
MGASSISICDDGIMDVEDGYGLGGLWTCWLCICTSRPRMHANARARTRPFTAALRIGAFWL